MSEKPAAENTTALVQPFAGLRPRPEYAAEVIAPPYDVINVDEARQQVLHRPWSFLHISRAEIDLPAGTDPYAEDVYRQSARNLARMMEQGILRRDMQPCFYLYQLARGADVQTGLVVGASVADYLSNRIRKHELTRPNKEDDRVRQIEALNAQTGPVLLTYRHSTDVDTILTPFLELAPEVDVPGPEDTRHRLWVIDDEAVIGELVELFEHIDTLYIADGHHRSAAAARVAGKRTGAGGPACFLAVLFPDNALNILGYHRVVTDLNGLSDAGFVQRLAGEFVIEAVDDAVEPAAVGEFGLYLPGQWYRLRLREQDDSVDAVAALDVSILTDRILTPHLAITDLRRDRRIDFVGGSRGVQALQQRVDSGDMAAAFSLYPTPMGALMAVADAHQVMPPKSTWFDPKLADGMVSLVLD